MKALQIKQKIYQNPAILGLSISSVLLFGLLIQEYLLGRFTIILEGGNLLQEFWIAVVHCLLAGYLPGAYLILLRGMRNTVEELEKVLKPADPSYMDYAVHIEKRGLLIWGFIGLMIALSMPYLTAQSPWDPSTWNPEVAWHRVLGPFAGLWFGWLFYAIIETSALTTLLAARIDSVDLLDLSPLSPFVKQGMLTALLIIGSVAICSLYLLDPRQLLTVAVLFGLSLPLALLGLLLPVRGVHQRIHEAKQAEIKRTREKIQQSKTLLQDVPSDVSSKQTADLIAYLQLIEDVQEWPIKRSNIVQLMLYLLIPIAAWFTGLLIEGLLNTIFGI